MNPPPFFIVGAPRSGTTMLAVILNQHSELYVGPNAYGHQVARLLGSFYDELSTKQNFEKFDFEQQLALAVQRNPRLDLIFDTSQSWPLTQRLQSSLQTLAHSEGKTVFGDKCPPVIDLIQELRCVIPNARFIHVVRDGRSVALSQQKRQNINIVLAIHRWKKSIIQGEVWRRVLTEKEFFTVKYEDLLTQPMKIIPEVCAFLGVEYESQMHDLKKNESTQADNAYVIPEFDRGKINTWQHLSPRTLKRLEQVAGDVLQRYGYELSSGVDTNKIAAVSKMQEIWLELMTAIKILGQRKIVVMREQKLVPETRGLGKRLVGFIRMGTQILFPTTVRDWLLRRSRLF